MTTIVNEQVISFFLGSSLTSHMGASTSGEMESHYLYDQG